MTDHKNSEISELKLGTPLSGVIDFADGLTHVRNALNFRTVADRVDHLALGGGEMLKAMHREDKDVIPRIAAKTALRIFTVLQGLEEFDAFIQKLMDKFPVGACSYCGKDPCQCSVDRPKGSAGVQPTESQRDWSLQDWQNHLQKMYGASNHAKGGLLWTASRLSSEIKEVLEARMRMDRETALENIEKYKQETLSELADSLAWVMAVCNEVGANLEESFVARYAGGCEHCRKYPCECGAFEWVDDRNDQPTSNAI